MKRTNKSQGNTSATPQQREFLEQVHGYTEPPTIWELSQLAAMLGGGIPADHSLEIEGEASRRVELAARIWDAAGLKRQQMQRRLDETKAEFDSKSLLYGPLKVGTHYMPPIQWKKEGGVIPYKRYLEQVVGMAREEDRITWWRAYLTAKIRKDQHRDYLRNFTPTKARKNPKWRGPDDFPIGENVVAEAIATQREEGFQKIFSAKSYAEGFRNWRLGMKTPRQQADTPTPLEEAVKKGLEAEETLRFRNPMMLG